MSIISNAASLSSKGNIFGITNGDFHDEVHMDDSFAISGTGTITANILLVTGSVQFVDQYGIITAVTTLTNATDVYFDVWDGTTAVPITKTTGGILSGFTVGGMFLKDQTVTTAISVMNADQARFNELSPNKVGAPFIITSKNGATNYIRMHLTTTDNPVSFSATMHVTFRKLSHDGNLVFQ